MTSPSARPAAGRPSARPAAIAPPHPRLAAVAVAVLLLVTACGGAAPTAVPTAAPGTPSASPTSPATPVPTSAATPTAAPSLTAAPGDEAALYRAIEDQVAAERGLPARQRLEPIVLSEAELKTRMEAMFAKDNPPDEIAVAQSTLVALGLLPAGASLEQLYVDMLGSQVAGFYDPEAKQLFVVSRSGTIGAVEKATFAHEFTHALQDQRFGLEGIDVDAVGQGDRSLARLAVVEGDATLLMTRWMVDHLSPQDLQELLVADPQAQAQLEAMPAILRDTLLFPYLQGLTLVTATWMKGGWEAVNAMYGRLPDSTEQVLHPEKYQAGEKPVPVSLDASRMAAAMGTGWSVTPDDTLGEYQLSIWLGENGVAATAAGAAAAGWGGDRYAYLRGPDGTYGLVLQTAWDTQRDAAEFLAAATTAATRLPGASRVERGTGTASVRVLIASDSATLARLERAAAALP